MADAKPKRIVVIPDTQVRPGEPTAHITWAAQWIVDHHPDAVVHLGDHWDLPSFGTYDAPGSMRTEGQRYNDDIEAGNDAFFLLSGPIKAERQRITRNKKKLWNPDLHFLFGNHEQRMDRAIQSNPKLAGTLHPQMMETPGWQRHEFLERIWIAGVVFSHYFQSAHSAHAIGGTIENRLNKIGASFVQGHQQGILYSTRPQASGATWHGLVAGSFYLGDEHYRGAQGQNHFRGIVTLNEVRNGDYCVMPLTVDYLCRKYEGVGIQTWLRKNYKDAEARFTLAR